MEVLAHHLATVDGDEGEVPELPGWTYAFHGRGVCLAGPNREVLDVDLFPEDDVLGQTIDPYFFATRVRTLARRPAVEERVDEWFLASRDLLVHGLGELRRRGVIHHAASTHVFQLHPWLESHYGEVAAVEFNRLAVLGRWSAAFGDHSESVGTAHPVFEQWVLQLLATRTPATLITVLAPRLPKDVAMTTCRRLLEGPPDATTGRAIEALRSLGAEPAAAADDLRRRLDPTEHNPYAACELAEWLLAHGRTEEGLALVRRFAAVRKSPGFRGNPFDDRYAVLALRFAPSSAVPLFRNALRSTVPSAYKNASALLSMLDESWCREELLSAARERKDVTAKRFLVACLLHSSCAETVETAQALMPPPPTSAEDRLGLSYEEVSWLNLRESVLHERDKARELAMSLRPH